MPRPPIESAAVTTQASQTTSHSNQSTGNLLAHTVSILV